MSDNVVFQTGQLATPPNATRVATDNIGGTHYQEIKLGFGDDGTVYLLSHGTPLPIGTIPGGTMSIVGTVSILGTVQLHGTNQALGTFQPLAGSIHIASALAGGTVSIAGSVWGGTVHLPGGTVLGTVQTHGTSAILGTTQPLAGSVHLATRMPGTVDIGTVAGTVSILGTTQPLAGSVHVANVITGTTSFVTGGTAHIGSVQRIGGTVSIGTVAGTISILGTTQPLAGSVHVANPVDVTPAAPVAADYLPVRLTDGASFYDAQGGGTQQTLGTVSLIGGAGTVGAFATDSALFTAGVTSVGPIAGISTVTTIGQGSIGALAMSSSRVLYVSLYGGTFDGGTVNTTMGTIPGGTVQLHGTSAILGTTQPLAGSVHLAARVPGTVDIGTVAGTVSVLGTIQPLAGSVHSASIFFGSVQGWQANDGAAAGNPLLIGAFGSSGTQSAVGDGDAVRLWADLNGRLQVRGTIDSMPTVTVTGTVQAHGTNQSLGTYQPLAGSVHVANVITGTTSFVTGGTAHIGSVQRIAGTVDIGTVAGTVSIGTVAGTVRIGAIAGTLAGGTVIAQPGGFGSYFGTSFTAAVGTGTIIPPTPAGTRFRIFDITVSASASGTVILHEAASAVTGTVMLGPLFFAGSGGWQFNSARGIVSRFPDQRGLFCSVSAGTMSVFVNYALEGTV